MALIALQSASTGLSALNTALDVTANNLANVNTAGFKASRANFQDLLYQARAHPGVENANGDERPTGLYVGLGTKVSGTQLNFEEGGTVITDRPLDVRINGNGFFRIRVDTEIGPGGFAFTRNGQFTLNSEGEMVMVNDQGNRLDTDATIPDNAEQVVIDAFGRILVKLPGEEELSDVGEVEVASFINPAGLESIGGNLYIETGASGPPNAGSPGEDGRGLLQQGAYEASNVDPTRELIGLIKTQRAFEMNSQTIRTADEVLQQVAQLRR